MGLWSAAKEAVKGNFNDAANMLWMDEEAITTQKEVNNAQQAIVSRQLQEGTVTEDEANAYFAEIQGNAYPFLWGDTGPNDVFISSVKENVVELPNNVAKAINAGIAGTSKFIAKAIPWYVWLILIIALLIYLAPFLKGAAKVYAQRG